MTPRFHRLSLAEFADLLSRFNFERRINSVHMHHTWRPNRAQFRGHDTIVGMWRYHTETNGWNDIAQHITIDPEGMIWTGRNWNASPASASGQNGSQQVGPFMFEMVGDFDVGRDPFDGPQRETALRVVALVQRHFGLAPETLVFHRSMSDKSCPGSSIDYNAVLEDVRALHASNFDARAEDYARGARAPFPDSAFALNEVLEDLSRREARGTDPADAELPEEKDYGAAVTANPFEVRSGDQSRGSKLSPDELAGLRPHVINLRLGQFSDDGEMSTSASDVDAIFEEHLPLALETAKQQGRPLRIVFYAHGGLVSESSALRMAQKHVGWWLANDVYPIYFVWETGFFETIAQLLSRTQARARGPVDWWDRAVEGLTRNLGGPRIWDGMKHSAALASSTAAGAEGGATYTAKKLAQFCAANASVELHAVGHSAGAIFHSHFLNMAHGLGNVPAFKTLHLLAPAARTDIFKKLLAPLMGNQVAHTTLFTMLKQFEKNDNCARIYRKSLLYLIHFALENARETPILGLEESLRADASLRQHFGIGTVSAHGEVVWSKTSLSDGRSASHSTTHGGFDDDVATMSSVARRILSLGDKDRLKAPFPPERSGRATREWSDEVDWPEGFEAAPAVAFPPTGAAYASAAVASNRAPPVSAGGRRRALCVGIDQYSQSPLSGCVADARLWMSTFVQLGFEPPVTLLDGQATRQAILDELARLLQASGAGDIVAFQYSGHGTQVPDTNGDEDDGTDEAICPYDMDSGAFLVDDDLADVLALTPQGVNVTLFMDCCHSGTVSRFAIGSGPAGRGRNERPRFIRPSQRAIEAHLRFRATQGPPRGRRGPASMREILFSACHATEVAWESGGQGEFTLRATRELSAGANGISHQDFIDRVRHAFGAQPRQSPQLDCAPGREGGALLAPLSAFASQPGPGAAPMGKYADRSRVSALLRELASQFE